jgi:hypothetical protein
MGAADGSIMAAIMTAQIVGGFKLEAAHKGAWGMNLRATIDLDVSAL